MWIILPHCFQLSFGHVQAAVMSARHWLSPLCSFILNCSNNCCFYLPFRMTPASALHWCVRLCRKASWLQIAKFLPVKLAWDFISWQVYHTYILTPLARFCNSCLAQPLFHLGICPTSHNVVMLKICFTHIQALKSTQIDKQCSCR